MKRLAVIGIILVLLFAGCAQPTPAPVVSGQGAATNATAPAATAAVASQAGPANTAAPVAPTAAPSGQAVAAAPATPGGTTGPLTKLTLAMGYIPSVQFAPFYVAQERGYFRDAGLDVTFRYGFETDLLKLVGTNQLQFMIGSGDQVILGRSQGIPVRYVMRWYRRFPVVLFAKEEQGIKTPKDLEGKTVGVSMLSGADYVGWKALVYGGGVDESKVNLQVIGFTQAAAVTQNRVNAAVDYAVNGPVQLRQANQPVTVLPVSDYMDLPSNGIITNDQTIRDHPELVQALVTATLHGLQDTLADPDAAFAACLQAVPEAGGDKTAVNRAIFDAALKLWQAEPGTLGRSDSSAWEKAATFMKQTGLVDRVVPASDLYTNQFIPGAQ